MVSRLVVCPLLWACLALGAPSIEAPMNMRLPRSPQMPPIVAAKQPSQSKSVFEVPIESIHIEQKSSHRHPYLTRYAYNDADQIISNKVTKESQKRSAMPSSPFIASRISVRESKSKMDPEPIMSTQGNLPPKNYFPKYDFKKSSLQEMSIKQYFKINKRHPKNKEDGYPARNYGMVLDQMEISDEEARNILQKKGVIFEEFLNFIEGGASMEQVKQILHVTELEDMRIINKTVDDSVKFDITFSDKTNVHNEIPSSKSKNKQEKYHKKFKNNKPNLVYDANDLPSKDSPMIAHFRTPQIKSKDIGSAAILSLSVEKTSTKLNSVGVTKTKDRYHPHKAANSLKDDKNYQSDQATIYSKPFRFEDGLRLFLIICGGIGGIILLATVILVIYNVLTCKESRMAQRNYQLSKQIRNVEESMEIC